MCAGKNSFLWEGRTPKVIITEPEQIKNVFNKMQDFTKPKFNSNAKFLFVGLTSYEGEEWAKHRKIINPAFHIDKLKVSWLFINLFLSHFVIN